MKRSEELSLEIKKLEAIATEETIMLHNQAVLDAYWAQRRAIEKEENHV